MKSLLITGGTGELGHVVVETFKNDYNCIILGRNETPTVTDVFGVLHIAGAFTVGSSPDDFAKMLDANLMSAVRAIEAVRDKIADGGRIVGISSIASRTTPTGLAAYGLREIGAECVHRGARERSALTPHHCERSSAIDAERERNPVRTRGGSNPISSQRRRRFDHWATDRNDRLTWRRPQNVSTSHARKSSAGSGLLIQ